MLPVPTADELENFVKTLPASLTKPRHELLGLVEQTPDMTVLEKQQQIAAQGSMRANIGMVSTFLDRCRRASRNVRTYSETG